MVEPREPARSWLLSLLIAAGAIYIPQLLPFVLTDVARQESNLENYLRTYPIVAGTWPGLTLRFLTDAGEPWEEVIFYGVSAVVTGVLLLLTAAALRRFPIGGWIVTLLAAGLAASASMFFATYIQA